ncbi:hypothetical protein, partial [Mesorhizobium sp. M7A.F.Ca.CA.001.12.1.1]
FGLLLLVALFPARLLFLGWRGLFGRRLLGLLLLVALLPARLLFLGRSGLFGRRLLSLLLLVALLPAWLLLLGGLFALGRRGLLFRLGLLALALLFGFRLLLLCAGFAFGACCLRQDEWGCRALGKAGRDTSLKRERAQRRGCHKQAECRACQNPWLAFHRNSPCGVPSLPKPILCRLVPVWHG